MLDRAPCHSSPEEGNTKQCLDIQMSRHYMLNCLLNYCFRNGCVIKKLRSFIQSNSLIIILTHNIIINTYTLWKSVYNAKIWCYRLFVESLDHQFPSRETGKLTGNLQAERFSLAWFWHKLLCYLITTIRWFPPPRFSEGAPAQCDSQLSATLYIYNYDLAMSDYPGVEACLSEAIIYKRQCHTASFWWLGCQFNIYKDHPIPLLKRHSQF
jgi:hypothetical protein